ncbi:four helix bundle protein [Patescibacteria group bacterium]|nr:four helix bundle protein [Patescibacteria group bacterium]
MKSNFQKLLVWQKAMIFVVEIYKLTEKFPASEKFGLVSQMQRAAVSIPSNIAEGYERKSKKDFAHFLVIAKSSAAELETQILVALMLKYLTKEKSENLVQKVVELKKMLSALRKKVLQPTATNY